MCFEVLDRVFAVLQEMSRSCMSDQGLSSFDSLGND